jgi:hypothetical protein
MSVVMLVIIGGWVSTFVMFGLFALHESGKLAKIRKHLSSWLEIPVKVRVPMPEKSLLPDRDDAA